MASVGNIAIDLLLNTAKFATGIGKSQKTLKTFARKSVRDLKKMRKEMNAVAKRGALMGTAVAAGLAIIVKSSLNSIDALAKVSAKLGIASEKLAGLQLAAALTGVKTETMNMALQRMVRRLSEAAAGTGEAKDALKELGLDAKELAKATPDVAFKKIAAAMEAVKSQSDKVRLSFKLFDSEGVALVNTLSLGEAGLNRVAMEAETLGIALNSIETAKVEAANDAMLRGGKAVEGIGNTFTVALAPAITNVANAFTEASLKNNGFREAVKDTANFVIGAAGLMTKAFIGFFGAVELGFFAIKAIGGRVLAEILAKMSKFLGDLATVAGAFSGGMEEKLTNAQAAVAQASVEMSKTSRQAFTDMDTSAFATAERIKTIEDVVVASQAGIVTAVQSSQAAQTAAVFQGTGERTAAEVIAAEKIRNANLAVQIKIDKIVMDGTEFAISQKTREFKAAVKAGADEVNALKLFTLQKQKIIKDAAEKRVKLAQDIADAITTMQTEFIVDALKGNLKTAEQLWDSFRGKLADIVGQALGDFIAAEIQKRVQTSVTGAIMKTEAVTTAVANTTAALATQIAWTAAYAVMTLGISLAITAIIMNFQKIVDFFENALKPAIDGVLTIVNAIGDALKFVFSFGKVFDFKMNWPNWSGKGTVENLLGIDIPYLNFAEGGVVPGRFNGMSGTAGDTVPAMLTPGETVVPRGRSKAFSISDALGDLNPIKIIENIVDTVTGIVTGIASGIGGVVGNIAAILEDPLKVIKDAFFGNLQNMFSNISLAGMANGGAFGAAGLITSPGMMPFSDGMRPVGEGGDEEAIMPLQRNSNGQLGVDASGAGGVTIIINGNFLGDESAINDLVDVIDERIGRLHEREF